MSKQKKKKYVVGLCFAAILIAALCACQPNIKDETESVTSGEELTEQTTEETIAKKQETDPEKEPLSRKESVAESVRAKLEYELEAEEFAEIAEMLRNRETDRWVTYYSHKSDDSALQPGNYQFRVYVDLSDDILYLSRKNPKYYVWVESLQNTYSSYGESEKGFCTGLDSSYVVKWKLSDDIRNLDHCSENEFLLLHEGEYVVEGTIKMIEDDSPEKKEILTGLWVNVLQQLYDDYEGYDSFYLSSCIGDFAYYKNSIINMELYYNWSVQDTGYYLCPDPSGGLRDFLVRWAMGIERDYSMEDYEKDRQNSLLVINGTVTKEWGEGIKTTDLIYEKKANLAGICGCALGAIAEAYVDEIGTIVGVIQANCYMTELNDMTGKGEGWITYNGREPIKIIVDYDYRKESSSFAYHYSIDENAVFDETVIQDCQLKMAIDLSTTCKEFDHQESETVVISDRERFENHNGYFDESIRDKYPTADYDGDGLGDRLFYEHVTNSELHVHFGNGERLSLGKPLSPIYWGSVRSFDITGDGVNELIYDNISMGADNTSYFYGIWQLEQGEWKRITIDPTDDSEEQWLSGRFVDIPIQVERVNDTQIMIVQPNSGQTDVLEIGKVAMEDIWSAEMHQMIYTKIRWDEIRPKEDEQTGKFSFGVSLRVGNGDLTGKLLYLNGQWVVVDWNVAIAR